MTAYYEGDMPDTMEDLRHGVKMMRESAPKTWEAWAGFADAALAPSALDRKTKELVALGMSLTGFQIRGQVATMTTICLLSLVLMPAAAWLLATAVFALPPVWTGVAVLLAACPTGANAFLFATRYDVATGSVSGAVALGTTLSIVTISLMLLVLA